MNNPKSNFALRRKRLIAVFCAFLLLAAVGTTTMASVTQASLFDSFRQLVGLNAEATVSAAPQQQQQQVAAQPLTIGVCDTAGPIEVESTGGTTAPTAYPTLKDAFDAINAGTHTGSVNVEVCGNTTETASATLTASGVAPTSYTDVTVRPVGGARVIEGTITGAIIRLNGADNVTIDGRQGGAGTARDLTVRNNSALTATAAIWLSSVAAGNGASNNTIRNLELAGGSDTSSSANSTFGIIMSGTTISTTANGVDNDNNSFIANRIVKVRYGIVTRGTTTDLNINPVVTDNLVGPSAFGTDQINKVGIFMQADTGAIVSRNTVQFVGCLEPQACTGADRMGIAIGQESWSATDTTTLTSANYTVTRNIVHDIVEENTFSSVGIRLGTTQSGGATNNLIANNFVYNVRANSTSGDQVVGIGVSGGNADRIVFNSLSITGDMDPGASTASTTYGQGFRINGANGTNNANFTVMNNSFYIDASSSSTAAQRYYAITLSSNTYSFGTGGLNYNNYYINPANPQVRTGGLGTNTTSSTTTEFATLADWRTALTPPQDQNSIQANPQYVSPTSDLHIDPTSPNESAGTPITGVNDDIDGQVRPNGPTPDIGADEVAQPSTPGTLQFSSAAYSGREGNTVTVTVTRTGGSVGTVTVNYATIAGGTATGGAMCGAGVDYVNTSGTLTFAEGETSKTFTIQLCSDGAFEGTETINLQLTNATGGATIGTQSTATVNIIDVQTFNGPVNVGAGQTYTSLTNPGGLFEFLNTGNVTGNVTVNITSDLTAETGAISLNEFAGGFTITIQPSGGAARVISGSNSTTALLDFNGADGVIINGLNSGGNSLIIRNTGTSPAVRFINDASNNALMKTTLESGSTSSVLSISTGITTGNDNITVDGNIIRDRTDAAGVPFNGINLIGTSATVANSNITINNNQIINFTQAGIVVGTSENVTFTLNDIFQTASRTTALFGVAVNSAAGTNVFSQNTIHDLTTTLATTGMSFNDARNTTASRNHIFNFPSTSGSTGALTGIVFNGSSGNPASLTVVNNMVSIVPNFTNAQIIRGIYDFAFGGNTFTSNFNSVLIGGTGSGSSSTWACVRGTGAPTAYTMLNNICFNNRTGGTGNHFAAGDQSANTGTFVSDYNIFVGTGTTTAANFFDKGTVSAGTPVDFASWQAGPPARDANSQASNPGGNYTVANMFVSQNDLHLNTSGTNPALNAGTPVEGVTIDFDGQPRPSGPAPEIGADEIVPAVVTTVQFNSATYSGAEGTTATITVTRSGDTTGASTVNFATSDGTASGGAMCGAGVDYVSTSGTLNFAAGETTKTFTVQLCSDAIAKGDETVNLTLSNPTGGTIGSPATAVLTITNVAPQVPGTLALSASTYSVGESGGTVTITVSRTGGTDGAVTVNYALTDGTATGGGTCGGSVDYVNTGGTVSFANGEASKTFTVQICNDTAVEGNETFTVTLSGATGGATIGTPSSATVTITDDDVAQPGTLVLSASSYSVGEAGGTVTITVNRTGGSDGAVSVNYTLADGAFEPATGGAACGGSVDYVNTGGTVNFAAGETTKTFTVQICNDTTVEANETFSVTLSGATGGATIGTPSTAIVTITDDDTAPAGNVVVNPGNVPYMTLGEAIAAINAGTHTGAVTVDINASTTETGPIVLNSSGAGSASYTSIVITPRADNVTVAGPTTTGRGLIELNGADNVTIDGDNPNTPGINRNLTLQNTAANTITFTSVIRIALAATVVNTADNNTFRNLNIVGSSTGRNIAAATSTTASENTTFGILAGTGASTASATTAPAAITSVSTGVGAGATANNLTINNNSVVTAARAISINGTATSVFPGLLITNNFIGNPTAGDVNQVTSIGITAQGSTNAVISGNTVYVEGFIASSAANHGINVGVNSANITGATIEKNRVNRVQNNNPATWSAFGINLGGGNDHIVRNNFVSGILNNQTAGTGGFGTTFGAFGIRIAAGTGHDIYHNSVHLYGMMPGVTSTNLTAAFIMTANTQTGVDVRNNIFSNQITGGNPTGTRHAVIALPSGGTSAVNLTLNNNAYYQGTDPNSRLAQVGTTFGAGEFLAENFDPSSTTPATNFRAYTSTLSAAGTNDSASFALIGPPPFVSNTDLHIPAGTATRLESGGAPVGVTDDIDSEMRNTTTPDIGADEFAGNPAPANDIAALSIVVPTPNSIIITGTSVTPQARFVNLGSAAQTNVQVQFTITGPGGYNYTDTQTIATLNPGQSVTVTFAPAPAFTTVGTYTMTATVLSPDANPANNQVTGTFTVRAPLAGGTYTVGTGGDYTSLTNPGGIFAELNLVGATGNIVINITSDLTAETGAVPLNQLAGGFSVTIKPSGAPRVISGTAAASTGLIVLNGADNVTIDGSLSGGTDRSLTITNNQTGTSTVIWIRSAGSTNGANNNTIKNSIINGATGANATTTAGILTGSGVTIGEAAEAANNNNTIQNNWIYRVQNSMYIRGGATAANFDQNWMVTGNEMGSTTAGNRNTFRGALIGNAQNFTITGNLVHGIQSTATSTAAMNGIQVAFLVDGGLIARNIIHDIKNVSNSGTGAYGLTFGATSTASNVTVANNFIYDVAANGSATLASNGFGINVTAGAGYKFYFNSVNMNTNQTSGTTAAMLVQAAVTTAGGLDVRNNIFANTQTAGATRYAFYSGAPATVYSTIDFNNYFSTGILGFLGGDRATIEEWRTATGQDANSKAVDPLFVSPTDLHLQAGSPMINMGTPIAGITTDIDGQTRDTMPDIGADEFVFNTPGTLSLSSSTYSVQENGGTVTVTVNRAGGTVGAVSVQYTLGGGTATGGAMCGGNVDYVNTGNTINFAEGQSSQTFTVQICDDMIFEGNETFNVTLTNPTGGAVLGTPATATVTIIENDPMPVVPSITINDVTVAEGNAGFSTATFTVTVTNPNNTAVTVNYTTANGTATAGSDYVATSGTLTIPAGQTTATITVQIIGDTIKEANETFFVNLSSPTNATIVDGQGVGIIIDNDRATVADFDGDRKTDFSVWRPADGVWYVLPSTSQILNTRQFGANGDVPVPGDYDSDGKTDWAVFRPAQGMWYIQRSSDLSFVAQQFGNSTDIPVQGDYNGDGRTDLAVFRPSNGFWYIARPTGVPAQNFDSIQFGQNGDRPVQGDYDGDAKTDVAVYRNGTWFVLRSSDGAFVAQQFGLGSDVPVVGDFDGDGRVDFTVYRNNTWYILQSLSGSFRAVQFGTTGDIPMAADFDGDGIMDITVFRPSNGFWYVLRSSDGSFIAQQWGTNGDIPVPAAYQPRP